MHDTFAARAGRWSTRHRGMAIGLWLAFVLLAVAAGQAAGSSRATRTRATARPLGPSARSTHLPAGGRRERPDPGAERRDRLRRARPRRGRRRDRERPRQAARGRGRLAVLAERRATTSRRDRRSALVTFELRGDDDQTQAAIGAVVDARRTPSQGAIPASSSASSATRAQRGRDLGLGRQGLPARRDAVAAADAADPAVRVRLADRGRRAAAARHHSVMAALGLVGLVSHVVPMADAVSSVVLLIGLAVGVDYSLFYLRREREERARGRSTREAIAIARRPPAAR